MEIDAETKERLEYYRRLMDRLARVLAQESGDANVPAEFWDDITLSEGMLYEAGVAYVSAQIDRDEFDHKATGFLRHWRESVNKHTGKDGNHDRAADGAAEA